MGDFADLGVNRVNRANGVAATDLADASRVIALTPPAKDDDMSIFGKIKDAIFGKRDAPAAPAPAPAPTPGAAAAPPPVMPKPGEPASTPQPAVDVEAVLTQKMAAKGGGDLNWRSSIVDLMKLLDLDSSLDNRKELATELGYSGAKDGSAEMNIWLHKAVMKELARNGGKVPAGLAD